MKLESEAQTTQVALEIEIMSQLTAMKDNLFTSKIVEVILAEG